jgi:hypothetical protein
MSAVRGVVAGIPLEPYGRDRPKPEVVLHHGPREKLTLLSEINILKNNELSTKL